MLGRIVPIRNKFPDGPRVIHLNTVGEDLRKAIHMCFGCDRFKPDQPDKHCPISKDLHEFSKRRYVAVALTRCAEFVPNERTKPQVMDRFELLDDENRR